MAKSGVLTIKILGDASNFKRAMGDVQGKLSKVGAGAAKIGKAVAIGTAAAGAGALALGNEVLNTGGKLTSWRQKTATVFEGSADDIRKWADKNNETFGVTDDQLAGMAASFGDLLKPMGFTADQAADMAQDVVGLSGALSEWSGGQRSAAEVSEILSKAMLGERESLKELGISIQEADVQQRLLEKGQEDLTGAALQQAKAVATQELIFEKSTDAQKAYAEGGNKALRASNSLRAGLAELREQVADKLLPVVQRVTQWFADRIPGATAAVQGAFERVRPHLEQVVDVIRNNMIPVAAGLTVVLGAWAASAAAAAASTIAAIAPVLAVAAAVGALVAGVIYAYENFDTFRAVVDKVAGFFTNTVLPAIQAFAQHIVDSFGDLVTWVKTHWGDIKATVETVINAVAAVIAAVTGAIYQAWQLWGDELVNVAEAVWGFIRGTIDNAIKVVQGVITTVMALIRGDWGEAWDGIKQILAGVWDQIKNVVKTGGEILRNFLSGLWDGIKEAAGLAVTGIVGLFRNLPGWIVGAVTDVWDGLFELGRNIVGKIVDGIKSAAGGIGSAITSAIPGGGVISGVAGALGFPEFDSGGVVPGRRGSPQLILAHGGETVLPTHKRRMGGGGTTVVNMHLEVHGSVQTERDLAQAMQKQFLQMLRSNPTLEF